MGRETAVSVGTVLGERYRIVDEIGEGGMAVVYRAEDLRHDRSVAVKVLSPAAAEVMAEERFAREIEIAAHLAHPNIVGLIDSGEADGALYFVMPFIEGESLRDVLEREERLDPGRAIGWAREIADALAHAHERGLVHRDIKPENVLLQANHAVVGDFGIAKMIADGAPDGITRTGSSIGTLKYMSPEQLSGEEAVDARTDIYSLGCVLYEMLEGEPPFTGGTAHASMALKMLGEVPEHSRHADVPQAVWAVVQRALAPVPGNRFATAADFAAAITSATTHAVLARAGSRERRAGALWAAGVLTVAAATIGAGAWLNDRVSGPLYERLAVMPLANGSGDPREDFYVSGVHEDLVAEMQRAGLRVLNPSSTRRVAESAASTAEVAEVLEADALVEGSVERLGPRVIVELRLIDGGTEEVVWTDDFSGGQSDVLTLMHSMTLAVADATGADLSEDARAVLEAAAAVDPVLYELLLQARFESFKLSGESLDQAERYYRRAIARDSMSAEAWAGLGAVWNLRAQQGLVSGDEARARFDSIQARAPVEDLDPARRALATVWPGWRDARWVEAEELFLQALEGRPTDAQTRAYYAQFLMYMGRVSEAVREGERAARQAPDDVLVQGLWAQVLGWLDRVDEAEATLERARRFDPDAPYLLSMLRTTYHLQGRDSLAMESWRDSYRVSGDLEALAALEDGYEAGGYSRALRSVGELFEQRRASGARVSEWQVGTLYTRAGEHEKALEYLTLALDGGDPNSPSIAVDAIFEPMRADPRFQALVDRLQLPG